MQADVHDIESGISYKVKQLTEGGCPTLGDVEFPTTADRDKFLQSAGGKWNNPVCRPIIVSVGGKRIAASVAALVHKGDEENPVVSIYFWGSMTANTLRPDPNHQRTVQKAAEYKD
jgi:hypothetical protein